MKRLIRNSVFETNSSSQHSMSISEGNIVYDSISPDYDGVIRLSGGEYGWQTEKHNSTVFKANYLAQAYKDQEHLTEKLVSIIEEHTGAKVVINLDIDSFIDHQSEGYFDGLTEDEIKRLIFDKNSWIYLGNDNSPAPRPFFINDTYHEDGRITKPDYKYRLVIDGKSQVYEYIKYPTDEELRETIEDIMEVGIQVERTFDDYPEMSDIWAYLSSCIFNQNYRIPSNLEKEEIYMIRFDWRSIIERMVIKHVEDLGVDVNTEYRKELRESLEEEYILGCHPFFVHTVKFKVIEI
jgi:hypothetical protein